MLLIMDESLFFCLDNRYKKILLIRIIKNIINVNNNCLT